MDTYDPQESISADEWLALDEAERMSVVGQYHRHARIRLPKAELHAAVHVVVENQLAAGDERIQRTLARLMGGGLDRHEAVHAIGSVLARQLWSRMQGADEQGPNTEAYYRELDQLTARSWQRDK